MIKYVHHPQFQRLDYVPRGEHEASISSIMLRVLGQAHQRALVEQGLSQPNILSPKEAPFGVQTSCWSHKAVWVDQLKKFYQKATHIYEELGPWAADYFILQTVHMLRKKADLSKEFPLDHREDATLLLLQFLDKEDFARPVETLSFQSVLSSKVERLITFLECQDPKECSGIIFVRQRAIVSVLCTILSTHPRTIGRFHCATFVGLSNSAKRRYTVAELFDLKAQQDTMVEFRAGSKNLVIATDVLEEGIDVTACNLVICFDPPPNLKSFIQRRGRARMERSQFAIMLSPNDDGSKIDSWQELEKELIKTYQDEERARLSAASREDEEEVVDYRIQVESTGYVVVKFL
jgi:ERCC4-related helicase